MLIKKAKAVASVANNPNHNQSSRGTTQWAASKPLPCARNKAASTTAALSNSTRVKFAESWERTRTELSVANTAANAADTNANPTPR